MSEQHPPFHILLIDDDHDDRYFFNLALSRLDPLSKFEHFDNGESALKRLGTAPLPDCIFLDYNMPRMNGMQVLEKIKTNKNTRHIPVVMYSTSNQGKYMEEAKELGAVSYIIKPYLVEDLKKEIAQVIQFISNNK